VVPQDFTRQQGVARKVLFMRDAAEIDLAAQANDWPMKPSHLCPWCPHTSCPNWKPPPPKKVV
jgi:putative RecB family exonuclease